MKRTADRRAKRLFSLKQVVARLMKGCIPEYMDCDVEDIIRDCLSQGPPPSEADTDESAFWANTGEHVICLNTEKILPGDKHAVHLDVLFEANLPKQPNCGGRIPNGVDKMLIGIEIQNDFRGIDNILGRGIFYLSVMTVSQYGERFRAPDYGRLAPVCSIWICPMAPKEMASSILDMHTVVDVIPEEKRKSFQRLLSRITPQRLVIINLNGDSEPSDDICGFLWTLMNQSMEDKDKMDIMEGKFNMTATAEVSSSIIDYNHCFFDWFGRDNFKRHLDQKYQEGRAEGDYRRQVMTARKMLLKGFSPTEIASLLELPPEAISAIIQDSSAETNP